LGGVSILKKMIDMSGFSTYLDTCHYPNRVLTGAIPPTTVSTVYE
jgi:hypothetical protein